MRSFLGLVVLGCFMVIQVSSHGRLIEPPSRASMWRYGFDTPHDYNDHEAYCGGFTRQWQRNKGKCGICGDPWDSEKPRAHEIGGTYGKNVIVRKYKTGDVIPVRVELTANHYGYFEFRICRLTVRNEDATQECLDENLLNQENGTARYYPGPGNRIFESFYKLPKTVTCAQCVFQWRYIAGNNWGDCGNGTGAVGCGPQEEFRGCADITIGDNIAPLPTRAPTPSKRPTPTKARPTDTSTYTPEASNYWFLGFIISGTCLLVVLAIFSLLYAYYYHAGRAKQWLMVRRLVSESGNSSLVSQPPVAPPRHKRQSSMNNLHLQLPD
ncbi:uncharacterized protein [Fopius arisanus]|uniref:Chitin-binding type-4 domain-containing protein n=1 Tax=Fopius arisanus TaxID=64838 RepID=A0A9R1TU33_9HYME|nr:PREDICTED: uncharacterized protein LOC105262820 [Fopius arisanus]